MKIKEAAEQCKVRGYIYSELLTTKLWKNTIGFDAAVDAIPQEFDDWECFDPESNENPLSG
jgi:hypothetical protein